MNSGKIVINPVLRAIGLAMSVAVTVLTILNAVPFEANMIMLGIGLFAISLDAISARGTSRV